MIACPGCRASNADGSRFCSSCGVRLGASESAKRKTVSIVFCDLVGSTALGEHLDPEVLRAVLHGYFDAASSCIAAHGGTIEKYIGDAVVAVFGIPEIHEDDALRAVRAASELRDAVATLDQELQHDRAERLRIRAGVSTGEVLADVSSMATLMSGDAANMAARLEQAAPPDEILLSEPTFQLTRGSIEVEPVERLTLKGKSRPVLAYRLVSIKSDAEAIRRTLDAPMVGRRRQLDAAVLAFEMTVEDAACTLLTILGPPGVGKSRLTAEIATAVRERASVLTGRCLPYGRGITYWPIAEMVRQAIGVAPDSTGRADVVLNLEHILIGLDQGEVIAAKLAAIAGADTLASRDELPWAVRKLLEHLATKRPVVVFFEDLHWAEPTLLDLVDNVIEWSRSAPILVVCTARPELLDLRPTWGGGKFRAMSLTLERLSSRECRQLIRNRLGGSLEPAAEERITNAAEGNPLFVEQTLSLLVEHGELLRDGDRWYAAPAALANLALAPSIHAILAARIERLDAVERAVIETASVIGKEFYDAAITALLPSPEVNVANSLASLVHKDLIRARASAIGFDSYQFRHILIRDAAYGLLTKGRRAALHEGFATWLLANSGARLAEFDAIIGYHLQEAAAYIRELRPHDTHGDEIAASASSHLFSSGRRALGQRDMSAAIDLLSRAMQLVSDNAPERRSIALAKATALEEVGSFVEAQSLFENVLADAERAGARTDSLWARLGLADVLNSVNPEGSAELCQAVAEEAIPIFEESGDHAGLSRAWFLLRKPAHMRCVWVPLGAALEESLAHARQVHDQQPAFDAMGMLAHTMAMGPWPVDQAIARCEELRREAAAVPELVARIRSRIALLHAFSGRFDAADAEIAAAEDTVRDLGFDFAFGSWGLLASNVHRIAGRLDDAERLLRLSDSAYEKSGERGVRSTTLASLSDVLIRQGRIDEAEESSTLALEMGSSDDIATVCLALSVRAQVLAARGRHPEAEAVARSAIDAAGPSDMLWIIGQLWEALGRVLEAGPHSDRAADAYANAVAAWERKGASALIAQLPRTVMH